MISNIDWTAFEVGTTLGHFISLLFTQPPILSILYCPLFEMVLVFYKKPDGVLCALEVEAGTTFSADSVDEIDVSGDLERIRVILGKMTKDQILFTLRQVGLRPSNKSDLKPAIINAFIEQWERIYQRAQMLAQVAQPPPSAEQCASSVEKPSSSVEKPTASGYEPSVEQPPPAVESEDDVESSDSEWARCMPEDLENEVEEEDILNLDETFPADANIKIIRALKSDGERRGICIRMDVKNSDVEDFLYRLEKKGVIGDLDDFHVFFKGERVRITNHLHSFFTGSEHFITFVLRVKNLRGGGVRKSSKKQTEREKRFKALRERMDETTKSVGQDRAGFDDTLFRKCEAEIAQLQSNLTSASLGALVSKIGRDDIKAFREAMGDEDLLHQERDVWKVAHCFVPVLKELTALESKCNVMLNSFYETFTFIYGLACVNEGNRYSHQLLHDMVDQREKDIAMEEKKNAEIEAEVQKRLASLGVSGDVAM